MELEWKWNGTFMKKFGDEKWNGKKDRAMILANGFGNGKE